MPIAEAGIFVYLPCLIKMILIAKLLNDKLIEWTIPEKPNSSKQKYRITDKGKLFCQMIKNSGENK